MKNQQENWLRKRKNILTGRALSYMGQFEKPGTDESVPRRGFCAAWTDPSVPGFSNHYRAATV